MAATQMVVRSLHTALVDEPVTVALTVKSMPTLLKTVKEANITFRCTSPYGPKKIEGSMQIWT